MIVQEVVFLSFAYSRYIWLEFDSCKLFRVPYHIDQRYKRCDRYVVFSQKLSNFPAGSESGKIFPVKEIEFDRSKLFIFYSCLPELIISIMIITLITLTVILFCRDDRDSVVRVQMR